MLLLKPVTVLIESARVESLITKAPNRESVANWMRYVFAYWGLFQTKFREIGISDELFAGENSAGAVGIGTIVVNFQASLKLPHPARLLALTFQ